MTMRLNRQKLVDLSWSCPTFFGFFCSVLRLPFHKPCSPAWQGDITCLTRPRQPLPLLSAYHGFDFVS